MNDLCLLASQAGESDQLLIPHQPNAQTMIRCRAMPGSKPANLLVCPDRLNFQDWATLRRPTD
jgi:hypothetical protein